MIGEAAGIGVVVVNDEAALVIGICQNSVLSAKVVISAHNGRDGFLCFESFTSLKQRAAEIFDGDWNRVLTDP